MFKVNRVDWELVQSLLEIEISKIASMIYDTYMVEKKRPNAKQNSKGTKTPVRKSRATTKVRKKPVEKSAKRREDLRANPRHIKTSATQLFPVQKKRKKKA